MTLVRGRTLAEPTASPLHLGLATAFVVLVRVLSVWHRHTLMSPFDEAAPLAISRTLAGKTPYVLTGLKFDVGWGTLLTPLHWILDDPDVVHRAVQGVNIAMAVALLLVVRAIVLELFDVSPNLATWAAFVGVSMPGAVMQTQYTGSEVALSLGFAAFLLLGLRLLRTSSPLTGPAFASAAVGLFHVHARLTGLLAVAAILLVVEFVRSRGQRIGAGAGIVLLVAGFVIAVGVTERVQELVWARRTSSPDRMAEFLDRLDAPWQVVLSSLGMAWQQMVVTFGLAGIGAWVVARGVVRGAGPGPGNSRFEDDPAAGRRAWGFLLVSGVAAMAPAAAFMADRPLAPRMVYGRYWDALVVTLVALAVVVVVRSRPRLSAAAWAGAAGATLLVGGALALVRQGDIDAAIEATGVPGTRRIAGLLTYVGQGDSIDVWSITLVAVAVIVVAMVVVAIATVAGVGHRWRELMVAVTATLALGATLSARAHHAAWDSDVDRWREGGLDFPVDLVGDAQVAFQMRSALWQEVRPEVVHTIYQFYLPDNELPPVRGRQARSYEWVIADVQDPIMRASDAVVAYEYGQGQGLALWHDRQRVRPR